jgi:hypothetical protein
MRHEQTAYLLPKRFDESYNRLTFAMASADRR